MANKDSLVIVILDKPHGTGEGQTYNQRMDTGVIKTIWVHFNSGLDSANVFCHNKRSTAEKGRWWEGDRKRENKGMIERENKGITRIIRNFRKCWVCNSKHYCKFLRHS